MAAFEYTDTTLRVARNTKTEICHPGPNGEKVSVQMGSWDHRVLMWFDNRDHLRQWLRDLTGALDALETPESADDAADYPRAVGV